MQTEFTCGIYTAKYGHTNALKWAVLANNHLIAIIDSSGVLVSFNEGMHTLLTQGDLLEIAVLMNNIKRQYKQLQTTS
jgi:hypothetical protein